MATQKFLYFLQANTRYELTPLYDILSAWPIIGSGRNQLPLQKVRLAMAVRSKSKHYKLADLQIRHWQALAQQSGVTDTFEAMVQLVIRLETALAQVEQELPANFPEPLWLSIKKGMLYQQKIFMQGLDQII